MDVDQLEYNNEEEEDTDDKDDGEGATTTSTVSSGDLSNSNSPQKASGNVSINSASSAQSWHSALASPDDGGEGGEISSNNHTVRAKRKMAERGASAAANKGQSYEELVKDIDKATERLIEYLVRETEIIETVEDARKVIDEMVEAKTAVAVDCEGVNLGDRNSQKVTLVQVCDMSRRVFLFDVHKEPKIDGELKRLLEAEDIVKVMHDCKCDSEGLYSQFKIQIKNIFDTQSAHVIIKRKLTGGQVHHADKNVGIDAICSEYGGAANPFKQQIKGVYKKNQRYWAVRPMTSLMVSYAACDVLCLVPDVYEELSRQLSSDEDKEMLQSLSDAQAEKLRSRVTLQPRKSRGSRGGRGHFRGHNSGGYRGRGHNQGWGHGHGGGGGW